MLHELLLALSGVSGGIFIHKKFAGLQVCVNRQCIANYMKLYFSRLFRLFSGYMKYKFEDIKTSCNFYIGKMKNYGISVCTHAIENMSNI